MTGNSRAGWPGGAGSSALWPRFLLLTVLSFAVILAIYELWVRRWNSSRFLFGLKPLPRRPADEPSHRVDGSRPAA